MDGDGEHEKLGSEVNRVIARPRGMHNLKSQDFCLCIRRGGGGVTSYVLEKCDKAPATELAHLRIVSVNPENILHHRNRTRSSMG